MTISASEFASPLDNTGLQASAASVLQDAAPVKPQIAIPSNPDLTLPGGYEDKNGNISRSVTVRELNGNDEEKISRQSVIANPAKWIQTVLECGIETIGGERATPDMIKSLLIGDQDYILLEIRAATYGPDVDLGTIECPECKEGYDVIVDVLNDFPNRPMTKERQFSVPLKNGRSALMQIPIGADRVALFDNVEMTASERKTLLLSLCVSAVEEADGEVNAVTGLSDVRRLSVVDRNTLISTLDDVQPGPRYNELTHTHECGFEQPLGVGLTQLFPGL